MKSKYNINDRVIGRYEHKSLNGIIVDKKMIKLPFNMKELILYCVKKGDGHTEWINEFYLVKV